MQCRSILLLLLVAAIYFFLISCFTTFVYNFFFHGSQSRWATSSWNKVLDCTRMIYFRGSSVSRYGQNVSSCSTDSTSQRPLPTVLLSTSGNLEVSWVLFFLDIIVTGFFFSSFFRSFYPVIIYINSQRIKRESVR